MDKKKLIAPIIITVIALLYAAFWLFIGITLTGLSLTAGIVVIAIGVAIAGALIFTLRSRIKEVKNGEEDDISKY